ncbi:MAG: 3-isopropylmalate dehydratase large subunit [Bacillota bacterium]|nr:3-isopropylmalate dehydratase large subunit [Bacillota bacterium]
MGMTIGEKILARACNKEEVKPGEIITAKVDLCMTNDATTHISIDIFQNKLKHKKIFDPNKIIFIVDHNIPSESVKTAEVQLKMRNFAEEQGVHFYEGDGVCHQIMLEDFVVPGQLIVAADSHTCSYGSIGAFGTGVGSTDFTSAMNTGEMWMMVPETIKFVLEGEFKPNVYARDLILKIIGDIGTNGANYKIMEFSGPAVEKLTIDDRIVLCNMAVEAGAKTALFEADEKAIQFVKGRGREEMYLFESDEDAHYEKVYHYNLADIEPMVAKPHFVDNWDLAANLGEVKIDQCFIGSCNNGRIEELRVAADILKGKKVSSSVKLLISPASKEIYLQAINEGLIDIFVECGALVMNPNCSVCWGGCQGVIGEGEVLLSTGTRNFKGRAGHADSFVYLASAATVAASAITGRITDPRR